MATTISGTSGMADDFRETTRQIERLNALPQYNFNAILQSINSIQEPLKIANKTLTAIDRRKHEEERRRASNRQLQLQLDQRAAEREQQEQQQLEQDEAQEPRLEATDEDVEPATVEPLALAPQQPLPAVDLRPLGLIAGPDATQMAESQSSEEEAEQRAAAMLQQLLASPGQIFTFLGATDAESASPVLQVLFQVTAHGTNPFNACETMLVHYRDAPKQALGWVPQLFDFLAALTRLGYEPLYGSRSSGSKRRSGGEPGAASVAAAAGGSQGAGPSGSGSGAAEGGVSAAGGRTENLRCLLRLMAGLVPLYLQGRLDIGCGNAAQATGKELITALLRMLLDPALSAGLHDALVGALEALMHPWDETLWRRIRDATAAQAAELGPSHRAAYRLIAGVRGHSERVRTWQQLAALQLLKKMLPGSPGPQARAGGTSAGGALAEVRELLCPKPSDPVCSKFIKSLRRAHGGSGAGGSRGAADGPPDYWRLLTVLQCANIVVWNEAYCSDELDSEDSEVNRAARWAKQLFTHMEHFVRGQNIVEMQVRVFLVDVQNQYEFGCTPQDYGRPG